MTHVIWDWNGTLLDDTQAALDTLNIMLRRRGEASVAMPFYRDHFAFPVRPFYEAIGVCLEREDWNALALEYHKLYAEQPKCLNVDAKTVLERVRAVGAGQSILSALRQDLLEAALEKFGVRAFFDHVCGVDNLDGASKLSRAGELLAQLAATGVSAADIVMIGDALHDKEVADALGVRCVLCAQGSHAAWRLRAVAPTGDTLLEALDLALADAARRTI